MPTLIKLIVGLGNPGTEYAQTRHNAGFWFADRLTQDFNCQFSSDSKLHGDLARISSGGIDCRLIKPSTFMNESGRAVQAVLDYYKIEVDEMLVAHDEIDLDSGIARLKKGGGHGGHNGLRDIINKTGSLDFMRLRIGVGHPGSRDSVTPHVLGRPSQEDKKLIDESLDNSLNVMSLVFKGELEKAMQELHTDNK